jgi:hypothetical protein
MVLRATNVNNGSQQIPWYNDGLTLGRDGHINYFVNEFKIDSIAIATNNTLNASNQYLNTKLQVTLSQFQWHLPHIR